MAAPDKPGWRDPDTLIQLNLSECVDPSIEIAQVRQRFVRDFQSFIDDGCLLDDALNRTREATVAWIQDCFPAERHDKLLETVQEADYIFSEL